MAPLVTLEEAAKYLGIVPGTLYNWINLGKISCTQGLRKVGRRCMFDLSVLKTAVENGELAS